ncbi:ABC transporter permease [Aeribacillus alveayuensis]|uniref:ABC-type antimicrobial peptide transport system permease subunit n=1 Tax=Aeribacillus alveayuensis TaxID=279215 RepID=A0ABT9VLM9_9BACI|nr:ABC-type antimicrobial peptide transport system permease subunit [Bacillus alveayuensis]
MSFNQIVWKMAKVHYKKYIFYFLCNSFTVMFFFMFSTVYFNNRVVQVKELESIQYVLTVPAVALVVFTVFFISYAHNIFIKRRRSEFGLFMILGMSNRDLCKLLLMENGAIALLSIFSGISSGIIFSRIFFLLLMNSVGLHDVPFHLNSKMFLYSIITFFIVFSIAVGKSLFLILKSNAIHSLKSNKVKETIKMKNPLIGGLGLAIVIGSVAGLYYTYTDPVAGGEYLLLWAIATFIGLYISLNQFTSFFIELAKNNKSYYYRRLLFLTSLDYKFKKLTSILMLVTAMIMVTILYSTIILFTYMLTERQAMDENPYDIAFLQAENKNNLSLEELYSIIDEKENPVQKHLVIPIYYYYQKYSFRDWPYVYVFMPVDHFNKLTSSQMKLEDKEFLYYVNENPENLSSSMDDQNLILPFKKGNTAYTLKSTIIEKHINNLHDLDDFIVVSNSEFEWIKENLDGFESKIHLINVADWKKTANTVKKLDKTLKRYNEHPSPITDGRVERVASKVEDYQNNKNSNGILFFVTTFLSIIFFFGSFILLYLNLFSDIDMEKDKYKKLYKIGITAKETKRMISKEITTIFFVPSIVGTTLAFLYIVAMAKDVGGVMKNPEILLHFLVVAGIYHGIQKGFFLYARKKMFIHLIE